MVLDDKKSEIEIETEQYNDRQYFVTLQAKNEQYDFYTYFDALKKEVEKVYPLIVRFEFIRSPEPSEIRKEKELQVEIAKIIPKNQQQKTILTIFLYRKTLTYIAKNHFFPFKLHHTWYYDLMELKKQIIKGYLAFRDNILLLPPTDDTLLIKEGDKYDIEWQKRNQISIELTNVKKISEDLMNNFLIESKERYQQRLDQKKIKNN